MPSDAAPDRRPEPEQATAEQYRQRAVLLADLGRYDEARGELASGAALSPDDVRLLITLARVHLVSGQPVEALAAAEAAVTADPSGIEPQVLRAMALLDLGRFGEAARMGGELLRQRPDDPYALLSGAAIMGESRNGQESLNAAWKAVQLAPQDARGHLVLAVVTARMRLFDLAERAYREAIRLDPGLADVQDDVGVVRLEQRRQVRALGQLADAAIVPPTQPKSGQGAPPAAEDPASPAADDAAAVPGWPPRRRAGDPGADIAYRVRQLVLYGAGYAATAAVVSGLISALDGGASRVWAALVGLGGVALLWVLARRVPGSLRKGLPVLRRRDRWLAAAGYATLVTPVFLLTYSAFGGPWPLVAAIAVSAAAQLVVVTRGYP